MFIMKGVGYYHRIHRKTGMKTELTWSTQGNWKVWDGIQIKGMGHLRLVVPAIVLNFSINVLGWNFGGFWAEGVAGTLKYAQMLMTDDHFLTESTHYTVRPQSIQVSFMLLCDRKVSNVVLAR